MEKDSVRLDKFLWAARFYKTRALAQQMIDSGRVKVDGDRVKPARAIRPGVHISLRQGRTRRLIEVIGVSDKRGSAPQAQLLYREISPPEEIGLFDDE
ncbi:RNA-binding S4 domain-containing protein [Paracoccus aerodenitrificans]|uniref:RNA-binding S4 domain-containing protein n=1 Tax=Paracoccus aerodenitrificans TaxID=3017781 RepID=UPI0022EFDB13|nr:RNA-binding S4 domain-containing protein [Paracoccus aerodenitrificans]WBU65386.1 RNA-binding S4 domain-containing protein [Paracoccus aerodenitrificans]